MAEEGKKISFGFTKSIKKTVLKNVVPQEQKKVEYIECVDDKSIKIIGGEEKKDELLVIPMLGSKTWHDRIINKVDADIYEPKATESKIKDEPMQDVQIKKEKVDATPNGDVPKENVAMPMEVSEIKKEPDEVQPLTLEEQAAREIIADLNSTEDQDKEQKLFTVPITGDDDLKGKEESTLDDYENIPIDAFGMAMLRGMGWQPGKGIGKNEKAVPRTIPELRPKGMGLGADKLTVQKIKGKSSKEDEQLKLVKGSHVKIIAGKHGGSYGKVEGFDEEAARIILKLALGSEVITVNECLVQPVTSVEYSQNSKVLNTKTYEGYKNNEVSKNDKPKHEPSKSSTDDSKDEEHRSRRSEKSKKKSKKRRHQSSDDNSSVERKSRRKRDSSNSNDEEHKQKKSKKSKKHKSRDSSSERSSRKNRKKDKEREKTRHKKSDYSEPSEKAKTKHKNRRKSRSRSLSPRNRRRDRSRSYSPRR